MCWNQINNQSDIDNLMHAYFGFHDSCICSIDYKSGAKVDEKNGMCGVDKNCVLSIQFESQMPTFHNQPDKKSIVLKFIGLHRLDLSAYRNNFFGDISSCYLSFYKGFIVWADHDGFDPDDCGDGNLFEGSRATFVVAKRLEWKFIHTKKS